MSTTIPSFLIVFVVLAVGGAATGPSPPVFPTRFSTRIHEVEKTPNGEKVADCDLHWDAERKMTSYRNCGKPLKPGGKGSQMQMVLRFNDSHNEGNSGTLYYIYGYGPLGNTCNFWCDLQGTEQCNLQESLCQYDYVAHAKYNETVSLNGTKANVFKWEDKLGPISMNSLSIYVDAEHGTKPLMMHRDVHPFGKELGTIDTYFSSWSPKPPDSSAFDVPGIDKCPEGPAGQCQNAMENALKFFRK
jgi:hypothetical protein